MQLELFQLLQEQQAEPKQKSPTSPESSLPKAPPTSEIPEIRLHFGNQTISSRLLDVLQSVAVTPQPSGFTIDLPQLEVQTYESFKQVLRALQGKWNGKTHWFPYNPTQLLSEIIQAKRFPKLNPYSLFETPDEIIDLLFQCLSLVPDSDAQWHFIEPNGGLGAIARQMRSRFPNAAIDVAELDPINQHALAQQGFRRIASNWLTDPIPREKYDFAIMNPPFENTNYIDHVLRTYQSLKIGGQIASVVPAQLLNANTPKTVAFRNLIAEQGYWEEIGCPFKTTPVECLIIQIERLRLDDLKHKWQPPGDGYASYHARSVELVLESHYPWYEFLCKLKQADPSAIEAQIAETLDYTLHQFIADEKWCLLWNDRVKQQVIESTHQQLRSEDWS